MIPDEYQSLLRQIIDQSKDGSLKWEKLSNGIVTWMGRNGVQLWIGQDSAGDPFVGFALVDRALGDKHAAVDRFYVSIEDTKAKPNYYDLSKLIESVERQLKGVPEKIKSMEEFLRNLASDKPPQ